ncbi:MAG: DUF3347 domain-containing protein [Deltaproteobacteria bacterium]|nr:DUF3347 domain-containing protein [Deltaproteobacteria bacterium]
MTRIRISLVALTALAALSLAASACKSGDASESAPSPAEGAGHVVKAADAAGKAPFVGAYEQLRAALANDDLAAAKAAAGKLAAADGASAGVVAGAKGVEGAGDIAAARVAFGEASKAYIEQLVADPELAEGTYVFRCPMAKGYKKWVQLTDALENPYMGQEMLDCGSPSKLEP